jgi:translocation and assembly module TamB
MISGLNLYGIEQHVDQQHIQIEHATFELNPLALLGGEIQLQDLNMGGVTYTSAATKEISVKETIQLLSDIPIPLALEIQEANLKGIVFRRGDAQREVDQVRLAGRVDQNGLRLKRFEAEGGGIRVNLQGHAAMFDQPNPFQANFSWNILFSNGLTARGECDLRSNFDDIKFTLKLREPFLLETKGELELKPVSAESDGLDAQGKTTESLTAEVAYRGGNVQRHTLNKPDFYRLNFQGDVSGQNLPPTRVTVSGQGNLERFRIDKLEANTLGGIVEVNGHLAWQSEPEWRLKVNAAHIDPGLFWSEWPGKLDFKAELQGGINAGTPKFLFNQISVAGRLMEQPFQAAGDVTVQGEELKLEDLRISLGNNSLNVDGTAAAHLDLSFNFDVPSPAGLWPGFRGLFLGQGGLKGTRSNPIGTIALKGNNISYGLYTVENLNVGTTIDAVNTEHSSGVIKLHKLVAGNQVLESLSLNWSGDFKAHRARAEIVTASAQVNIEFAGSCRQDTWKLAVDTASFDTKEYGSWRLLNPVDLLVSHAEVKPFEACWEQNGSNRCILASMNGESGWRVEGDVDAPPLNPMVDLLRELFKEENLGWEKVPSSSPQSPPAGGGENSGRVGGGERLSDNVILRRQLKNL